jgi:hypothetical protein
MYSVRCVNLGFDNCDMCDFIFSFSWTGPYSLLRSFFMRESQVQARLCFACYFFLKGFRVLSHAR